MDAVNCKTINTPRLTLKPLSRDVLPALCDQINNLNVSKWLRPVPYPYTAQDGEDFLNSLDPSTGKVWSIHDQDGFVGVIGNEEEVGYWLAESAWGNGYGKEAALAVLEDHFADPDAGDLNSAHFDQNVRSAGLLTSVGFTYTGVRRRSTCAATGLTHLSHGMELTRARWEERATWLIETRDLVLRPMFDRDAADLTRIVIDPSVGPMLLRFPPNWTVPEAQDFIAQTKYTGQRPFRLGIEVKGSARLIGSVGVSDGATPEVYYFLDPGQSGRGLGQTAMQTFLAWLFAQYDLRELHADVFNDNPRSDHILTKLGFQKTGEALGTSAARLEPAPISLYRLSKQRFESMPS